MVDSSVTWTLATVVDGIASGPGIAAALLVLLLGLCCCIVVRVSLLHAPAMVCMFSICTCSDMLGVSPYMVGIFLCGLFFLLLTTALRKVPFPCVGQMSSDLARVLGYATMARC